MLPLSYGYKVDQMQPLLSLYHSIMAEDKIKSNIYYFITLSQEADSPLHISPATVFHQMELKIVCRQRSKIKSAQMYSADVWVGTKAFDSHSSGGCEWAADVAKSSNVSEQICPSTLPRRSVLLHLHIQFQVSGHKSQLIQVTLIRYTYSICCLSIFWNM